ncbi:unnamed protein product [Penicillium salamii]|uniref:Uncharacterized protein n=2 Tax=Penicillium TaxID=5073 RepID=A0A9W4JXK6_9EURO|nr:unnamed protein product [Penicillium salamii]CRL30692.1 unnamed protein product [Penicillium camemberti]CAG8088998.1 unnamed protein product [Penicillium salamii]CAG8126058.1 unnamed protein product [Penicillium salamii]CAG8131995.1 unnamed protein product [Penicillium salamii]
MVLSRAVTFSCGQDGYTKISSKDQEIGGDQLPSELPTLSEKDKSQESFDHIPLPTPSQQEADTRHTLATEPFQPILKVLADLESDDPNFAFPSARLVGLYRRLWELCVSKHINGQKLEQHNLVLKEAGAHLRKERDGLQVRHDKHLSRLHFFEQALNSSRERLTSVLDDWNHPSRLNLAGSLNDAREG